MKIKYKVVFCFLSCVIVFSGFSKNSLDTGKISSQIELEKEVNKQKGFGEVTDAQVEYQCKINYESGKGYLTDFQYMKSILALDKLVEAKNYEKQNLWIHALGSYYDIIDENPSVDSVEAYRSFQKLANEIKTGAADLNEAWNDLQLEFEQYWLEQSCVCVEDIGKPNREDVDSKSKAATYSVGPFQVNNSYKYNLMNDIVKCGFENAKEKKLTNLEGDWLQYKFDDFICRYPDFGKMVVGDNYRFEFVLVDKKGKNIFGTKKFVARGNQNVFINDVYADQFKKIKDANIEIVNWGYSSRHIDFVPLDLKKLKYKNENPISKIELEMEKINNASNGFGRVSNAQLEKERANNKLVGFGEISNEEVINQKEKNRKAGFGSITDFQIAVEKSANKKAGFGEITNEQVSVQRVVNRRAGFGDITDLQLDIQNKIYDSVVMNNIPGRDYQMLCTEVTQMVYESVMGENPSEYVNENFPVENVSWFDVIYFCNRLSEIYGLIPVYSINGSTNTVDWNYVPHTGSAIEGVIVENIKATGFRLPTQGEWDYAANGGKKCYYSGSDSFDEVAWNTYDQHPVAQKTPNDYGMFDMSGNVNEWWWTVSGDFRCYSDYSVNNRHKVAPESRFPTVGFRVMKLSDAQ